MAQQLTTKFREDEANEITENVAAVVDSLFYLLGEYLRAQIAARAENMAWGGRRDDSNANDVNNEQMENVQKMLTSRFIFAFARLCIKPLQASDKQTNSALPAFLLEDSNNCHSIFFFLNGKALAVFGSLLFGA